VADGDRLLRRSDKKPLAGERVGFFILLFLTVKGSKYLGKTDGLRCCCRRKERGSIGEVDGREDDVGVLTLSSWQEMR